MSLLPFITLSNVFTLYLKIKKIKLSKITIYFSFPIGKKKTEKSEKEIKGKDAILKYVHQINQRNRSKSTWLQQLYGLKSIHWDAHTDFLACPGFVIPESSSMQNV